MKKTFISITAFAFLIAFVFTAVQPPERVNAKASEPITSGVADGEWNTGTEIELNLVANPAPGWLQLLSQGDVLLSPARICHPFRGGQFKWVGEIRQLVDRQWVKLETESGWLNGIEGEYVACANAPVAGTYALFGYYSGPKEVNYSECNFDFKGFGVDYGFHDFNMAESYFKIMFILPVNYSAGMAATYKIISVDPPDSIDTNLTGSTKIIASEGIKIAKFDQKIHFTTSVNPSFWLRLEFPAMKCYKNVEFLNSAS